MLLPKQIAKVRKRLKLLPGHIKGNVLALIADAISNTEMVEHLNLPGDTDASYNRSENDIIVVVLNMVINELQEECKHAERNAWRNVPNT